jgi:hypothetical protein
MNIDWTDPTCMVSEHFSVHECLWLPSWNRLATEDDGLNDEIKTNLVTLCNKMEIVRAYLNCPIITHCMYRPPQYSVLVGGFADDIHTGNGGAAIDFDCEPIKSCDEVKALLLSCLEQWNLRLENNGNGASWCHIDTHQVIYTRYFKA